MASMSKLFTDGVKHRNCCNDLMHSDTCLTNFVKDVFRYFLSNMKYFLPMIFPPLLIKIRKLDKNVVWDTLKYYLEAVVTCSVVGLVTVFMVCVNRQILGKFNLYTFVWLPSSIGSLFVMLSTSRVKRLFRTTVFQCAIETFLIQRKSFIMKTIADSVGFQSFLFMCCSAVILHAKQNDIFHGFWLLNPNSKEHLSNNIGAFSQSPCVHKEQGCGQYLIKGVRNYMAIGLGLDFIKAIITSTQGNYPIGLMAKLFAGLQNFRLTSTALLTSYMAIYRFAHCYFNRKSNGTLELNHLTAGFLGGSCYVFYPNLTLLSYALVLSIQTLFTFFERHTKITNGKYGHILDIAKRIPYSYLVYSTLMGYLVHTYCFRKHMVSSMAAAIINGTTNNAATRVNLSLQKTQRLLEDGVKNIYGTYH